MIDAGLRGELRKLIASFGFVEIAAVARCIDMHAAATLDGAGQAAAAAPPWDDPLVARDLPALRALVDRARPADSPLYPRE